MSGSCHYDTVAFDVRDNATILFFARTHGQGDIDDYVLFMRTISDEFDAPIFIEVNECQLSGTDLIREVTMTEGMLRIRFREPVGEFGGESEFVLTFDSTDENRLSVETGAFRVLGDKLSGGHA
ncbi:MAG: hypothetical protein VYC03_08870 [Pseudomonadota bacterium]|nr:hypothetical protein [Pseudomonadota bacterium]